MRFKKVKVNQTKLCWNEQDLYFHQKTIREYSVKHDSFFHTCLTFCKYVWEKPNLCVKYHTCSFWQMFDFYPTCLEKTKHVGIFTPGCYFPHMFGFWHIGMGKGTHVWKKPHNYMFANVWHFPHMCGKSHWHAYFPLSYGWGVLHAIQPYFLSKLMIFLCQVAVSLFQAGANIVTLGILKASDRPHDIIAFAQGQTPFGWDHYS